MFGFKRFKRQSTQCGQINKNRMRTTPKIDLILLLLLFFGCTRGDMVDIARVAVSGNPLSAQDIATRKVLGYAANPKALERDIKNFEKNFSVLRVKFRKTIEQIWGKKETKEPRPKEYVKYTQNYLSRASVDFDTGLITVETLDQKAPLASLKNAIATTLLTPHDPRAVDLYTAKAVKLGETPFLFGEVLDHEGKSIRWSWRAERFAEHLVEQNLQTRKTDNLEEKGLIRYVTIPMVRDHLQIRAQKYRPLIEDFAGRFAVSKNLVFAIMKTESDFNPYAVSSAPAFGLMQIVPSTAGRDVSIYLNKKGLPTDRFLFIPENNIHYGTVYLHLLNTRYFSEIKHPVSREYCIIAAYNTGAGNVLRTFDRNREKAPQRINALSPIDVYHTLRTGLPYDETRRYLAKVIEAKKAFVY